MNKKLGASGSLRKEAFNSAFHRAPNWQEERGPQWLERLLGWKPGTVAILIAIGFVTGLGLLFIPS